MATRKSKTIRQISQQAARLQNIARESGNYARAASIGSISSRYMRNAMANNSKVSAAANKRSEEMSSPRGSFARSAAYYEQVMNTPVTKNQYMGLIAG